MMGDRTTSKISKVVIFLHLTHSPHVVPRLVSSSPSVAKAAVGSSVSVNVSASRIANSRFFMCLVPSFLSCRRFRLPHLCFDPLQGEFKPHGQRREQLVHHLLGPLADIQPGHKGQRSGYVFWRRDWRWLWPCCLILSTYLGTYANDTIIELRKQ